MGLIKKNGIIPLYQMGEVYKLYNMDADDYIINMDGVNGTFKEYMTCPHCKQGVLEKAKMNFPMLDYLICSHCDSTYLL